MRNKQDVFDSLLVDIITGKFKPRERLVEHELATKFRVSRTPIREAIRKLEVRDLVECFPNRGARVKDFSLTDIEDLFYVRINLERLASKLAFSNLGPKDINTLKEINRELRYFLRKHDLLRLIEKDRQFHNTIFKASRNDFLIGVIGELRLKSFIVAYYVWSTPHRIKVSISEHHEIINALKGGNRDKFQNLAEHQLVSAKAFYLENLR